MVRGGIVFLEWRSDNELIMTLLAVRENLVNERVGEERLEVMSVRRTFLRDCKEISGTL